MSTLSSVFILGLLLLLSSCSTKRTVQLKASHDVTVTDISSAETKSRDIKAGEVFSVDSPMARIEAPHRHPIIVLDSNSIARANKNEAWDIELKSVDDLMSERSETIVMKEMDTMYKNMIEVLMLAKKNKVQESINLTNSIIKKYPQISSLHFMKSQLLIKSGDIKQAVASLDNCLSMNPQFLEAKSLKNKLLERKQQ